MKESGVEWIGKIPKPWKLSIFKYHIYTRARLGWKGLKADEYVDDGYIFLATPNIKGESIDFKNVNYINRHRYEESPEIMLKVGDILLTKDGSTLGTVNIVRYLPKKATVNGSIAVLTPNKDIISEYLYYYLNSYYIQTVMQEKKDGIGVPHLFQRDINNFNLIIPSIKEQQDICNYLNKRISEINTLITKKQELITQLELYKKSLVYECVTGKKEVAVAYGY